MSYSLDFEWACWPSKRAPGARLATNRPPEVTSQGWAKASELPYLQPNERWTKGGCEFVIYITPKGAEGVAVINIQVRAKTTPYQSVRPNHQLIAGSSPAGATNRQRLRPRRRRVFGRGSRWR